MLRVGVLGAGHLGKTHLKLLQKSKLYHLVGFFDPQKTLGNKISQELGCICFDSMSQLIDAVDVVDIVTPTVSHFSCAKEAIKSGKHVFIEKPISKTLQEAEELISLAEKYHVKGQVGHVEQFNPAFVAVRDIISNPMFIEVHRLAEFNPRGTDVPVVLDLMIHDIDIILSVLKSKVKAIHSNGVPVVSQSPDIANARIEFENGGVANLTASRISMKNMRKIRFFQKDAYISVDFYEKKAEVVRMKDAPQKLDDFAMILKNADGIKKQIYFEYPEIKKTNAILEELESLANAIEKNISPMIPLKQGAEALRIANEIINNFDSQLRISL